MHKSQLVAPLEEVYSVPNELEQLEHVESPSVSAYSPFSHELHFAEPEPEYDPAGPEKGPINTNESPN